MPAYDYSLIIKRFSKLILTESQFIVLSEISRDIAQVFFASMVVSPFLVVDKINWIVVLSGGFVTGTFWIFSILFARKEKNESRSKSNINVILYFRSTYCHCFCYSICRLTQSKEISSKKYFHFISLLYKTSKQLHRQRNQ